MGTPCQCHWMCLSIRKTIYGLGVGIGMVSEILGFLLKKGVGHAPGSPRMVSLDVSKHKKQEYIW